MSDMKAYFDRVFQGQITRPGSAELLKWLKKSDFFTAPASSRFHLSRPGGLVEHSVNVYERLKQLCECEALNDPSFVEPSPETIAVIGLLHDVCKIGVYIQSTRNQKSYDPAKIAAANPYQVKHDQLGDFIWESIVGYQFDDPIPYGHGEKSVYLISEFMKLTREEAFAIRFHMGAWTDSDYDKRNAGKAFDLYPLALFTHLADMMATHIDDLKEVPS